jgi:hypothetical protein
MISIEKIGDKYYKPCFKCGEIQSYSRLSYAKQSLKLKKSCKKCSNRETNNCHRGYYEQIPITWFNKSKTSAELRDIKFEIKIEDVHQIMLKNNFKCYLSGLDISFNKFGAKHPASIDRIDSSLGYTLDNIQIIHKDVNFMKQSYSQEYFIQMCKNVSNKWS